MRFKTIFRFQIKASMQLFALPGFSRLRTGGLCSAVDAHTPTFHVHPQLSTAKFKNYVLVAKRLTLAFLAFLYSVFCLRPSSAPAAPPVTNED
jgi:hypothetical protein